jgi:hypothetical protein
MKTEDCGSELPFILSSVIYMRHLGMLTVEGIAAIKKKSQQAFMQE